MRKSFAFMLVQKKKLEIFHIIIDFYVAINSLIDKLPSQFLVTER